MDTTKYNQTINEAVAHLASLGCKVEVKWWAEYVNDGGLSMQVPSRCIIEIDPNAIPTCMLKGGYVGRQ